MKKMTFITTVLLAIFLAFPVYANSLYGMKGLIAMPVADTQPQSKFGINFHIVNSSKTPTAEDVKDDKNLSYDQNRLSISYGLWENVELYVNLRTVNSFDNPLIYGGLKARVVHETNIQPALAVGLMNTDLYVVASKTLERKYNVRGHIGFGTGKFEGLYFGFNKVYNPISILHDDASSMLPMTNFELEFIKNSVNLGVDVHINQYFTLNIATVNFRGLTYGFGYSSQF